MMGIIDIVLFDKVSNNWLSQVYNQFIKSNDLQVNARIVSHLADPSQESLLVEHKEVAKAAAVVLKHAAGVDASSREALTVLVKAGLKEALNEVLSFVEKLEEGDGENFHDVCLLVIDYLDIFANEQDINLIVEK